MGRFERSIKVALDKISGEVIEADQVFDTPRNGFEVRKQFHRDEVELYCCECAQKLNVSTSKFDRLHFKHGPGHDYCTLSEGKLTAEEQEEFTQVYLIKETPRHKELKNKIGHALSKTEGVDLSSIAIDNKFIFNGKDKRRPDVYCRYKNKELVFEIQISNLSLRYIYNRYEFYKNKGIYLIWILDNLDIHSQTQLARDIKYLTKYDNFFRLDESNDTLKLSCEYKFPFLTDDNRVLTKWLNKNITLDQINFDAESCQIYYYDFGANKALKDADKAAKEAEAEEQERQKNLEQRLRAAHVKAIDVIRDIKDLRQNKWHYYGDVKEVLNEMTELEISVLNKRLKLDQEESGKRPAIIRWIASAGKGDFSFIHFLLTASQIRYDPNRVDPEGSTALQEIYKNEDLWSRPYLVKLLFQRGYELKPSDTDFLVGLAHKDAGNDLIIFKLCSRLKDKSLLDMLFKHINLVYILESARTKTIVGFNYKPNQWSAFAINAIQYYQAYWNYIEPAFKMYCVWDLVIEADKKGTFQKKVFEYHASKPNLDRDCDELIDELFPDVYMVS